MGLERPIEWVWRPQVGPQHSLVTCPFPEIFYGGARGGGKTDGVLGKWALKAKRYGAAFNARMFRKTTVSSEDAIERSKQIFGPLGAKFNETSKMWRMPQGGRVGFAYLDSLDDAANQQGKNLTDGWIEEAGQYPDPAPIDRLFGALRSADGVPVQLIITANPGGPGQHWLASRYKLIPFPDGPKILERHLPNGAVHRYAVIPSRLENNRIMLRADPEYINRLQMVGSPALVKAWLEGDWSAIEGAFFPEWNIERHILAPFEIPSEWTRFRSADWGSAAPFSIGWWAVVGDYEKDDQRPRLPRGALLRYREWYGASAPNVGLKLPAEDVADRIKELEAADPKMSYGVFDPAAFASDGGPSIAERMARKGVMFRPADNARVARRGAMGGWDQLRGRLIGNGERPMLYVFSTCRDLIRTLPALQHDQARPEDVDTDLEDHAPDEARYACMSRPWTRQIEPAKPEKLFTVGEGNQVTMDDVWPTGQRKRAF